MSAVRQLLALEAACAVCGARAAALQLLDAQDAELPPGEVSLQTKLSALANHKTVTGHICGDCAERASAAWALQQQLLTANAEPALSDKIRVLRQRLRELTDNIDVFIVIGPEKTDGQPVYTEDNIIVVDKNLLGEADDEDEAEPAAAGAGGGRSAYQCTVCPEAFPARSAYLEHARTHPPGAAHSCWTCGQRFASRAACRAHRAHHVDVAQLACNLCRVLFQSQAERDAHRCETRCPGCAETFPGGDALAAHARLAHGAGGRPPYVCSVCRETFTQSECLVAHGLQHRTTQQYVCGHQGCVQRFTTRGNLLAHVRDSHASLTSVRCSASGCELAFASAAELRQHARAAHQALRCAVCLSQFVTTAALRKHMRTHEEKAEKRGRLKKMKSSEGGERAPAPAQDVPQEAPRLQLHAADGALDQHALLIQQEDLEGEYQLECVAGDEMAVEMLEEEVEYLEVETLDDLEEDVKTDFM